MPQVMDYNLSAAVEEEDLPFLASLEVLSCAFTMASQGEAMMPAADVASPEVAAEAATPAPEVPVAPAAAEVAAAPDAADFGDSTLSLKYEWLPEAAELYTEEEQRDSASGLSQAYLLQTRVWLRLGVSLKTSKV